MQNLKLEGSALEERKGWVRIILSQVELNILVS